MSLNRWISLLGQVVGEGGAPEGVGTTSRAEHQGLLAYSQGQAPPMVDLILPAARRFPAAEGRRVAATVWAAMAEYVATRSERSAVVMRRLLDSHDGKSYLHFASEDPPEAWWYDELVLLHAATSYAIHANDPVAMKTAMASAAFVHAEIQPDHATADPWAIHAMILHPPAQSAAEGMLNACMVQYEGSPRGVALVLLADVLYCLRHVASHGIPQPF